MSERLIPVEEALRRVLASATAPLDEEWVPLTEAAGRTLARDVAALRTQPPFANSAMDGYALAAADASTPGAKLRLVGESAAGRAFSGNLASGETVRIFTGAPLPEGADAIAMQEDATRDGQGVRFAAAVAAGENVRYSGIDFSEGEPLLRAGRRLNPRDIALAAAANHVRLACTRRPRVAVLATGDELVSPGEPIGPSQIVASNNLFILGLAAASGAIGLDLGIARDDPLALAEAIRRAIDARADILVTLGGASVGDYDLVQAALVGAGMELGFWKIAMRPGKPLMHGRIGSLRVLGLPGNPTSSAVCGLFFLRPLIRALLGDPKAGADLTEPARLGARMGKNGIRQDYVRATLERAEDGGWIATALPDQDSSLVKMLSLAEALIIRAIGAEPAEAGAPCRILRLAPLGG